MRDSRLRESFVYESESFVYESWSCDTESFVYESQGFVTRIGVEVSHVYETRL